MRDQQSLLVNKSKFADCNIETTTVEELREGEVLLHIDKFALTSNNITYAVVGDMMGYWNFFPAEEGMGRIPVWGFATVAESKCSEVKVGERFYGYYPMANYLKVIPAKNSDYGFMDGAEHRQKLSTIYNYYVRTAKDSVYTKENENLQCLLGPLFTTSFLIDVFFADKDFFGSRQIILTSASSKTALALAYFVHRRNQTQDNPVKLIGLTSPKNQKFVTDRGYYDEVLTYPNYEQLDASVPSAIVEFAGNHKLQYQLQTHLGDSLRHNCLVGLVHWEEMKGEEKLPQKGDFFFAPTFAQEKQKEWGREEFNRKWELAWKEFIVSAGNWLNVKELSGADELKKVYLNMLKGDFDAKDGYIFGL